MTDAAETRLYRVQSRTMAHTIAASLRGAGFDGKPDIRLGGPMVSVVAEPSDWVKVESIIRGHDRSATAVAASG
jgi:hypothetical protein